MQILVLHLTNLIVITAGIMMSRCIFKFKHVYFTCGFSCRGVTVPPALGNDSERLAALCDALASSVYDLVLLQEVRSQCRLHKCIK